MSLTNEQLSFLKKIVDSSRVWIGEEIGEDYSHDELGGSIRISGYSD